MHRRFHHFHRFYAAVAVVFLLFGVACNWNGSDDATGVTPGATSTGTPIVATGAGSGTGAAVPISEFPASRQPWPEGQPVVQSQWVKDRLAAMKQIFAFTPAGEEWIDGYDLRQMVEQPAWFGSFGYGSWAGAGEAVPRSVLHEINHSYWGAFSIDDAPDLSWDTSNGIAEALLQYREHLLLFMLQPPDRFEPLRDRFRNLPGLSTGEYPDLAHFGEADILYMTGGNLELIPPILQPYFSGFLATGGAGTGNGDSPDSWDVAIAWFNALSSEDRRIAGEVFGLQHFPQQRYVNLPNSGLSGLDSELRTLYENEERQRLVDLESQFDGILDREFSLVDAAGADRGFDFWRSYLSDKLALHQRYPDALRDIGTARGSELASALDFFAEISGFSSSTQVARFKQAENQSLVPELAVLLRPRAIVDLFSDPDSNTGIATVLGSRADRLTALVEAVDDVKQAQGQDSSGSKAAASLEAFIRSVPEDQFRSDAFLLLDLLRSSEQGLAADVLPELNDETLQFILRVQPAFARTTEIGPDRLLRAVGITGASSINQILAGATLLAANSSGNFAIDAAYDEAVFKQIDRFVESAPVDAFFAVSESGMRLVPWIERQSDGALRAMRAAPEAAADVLVNMSGTRETPWQLIHAVALEDPALAASLTVRMEAAETAHRPIRITVRAIREFGYDLYWSERNAASNVDPERLAEYLLALSQEIGTDRVEFLVQLIFVDLNSEIRNGAVEPEAVTEYTRTLQAALSSKSGDDAEILQRLVEAWVRVSTRVVQPYGL